MRRLSLDIGWHQHRARRDGEPRAHQRLRAVADGSRWTDLCVAGTVRQRGLPAAAGIASRFRVIQPSSSGLLPLTTLGFLIAKILCHFSLVSVFWPDGWCGVPYDIFLIS